MLQEPETERVEVVEAHGDALEDPWRQHAVELEDRHEVARTLLLQPRPLLLRGHRLLDPPVERQEQAREFSGGWRRLLTRGWRFWKLRRFAGDLR